MRACELEEEFAELGGWEAESDASGCCPGLGMVAGPASAIWMLILKVKVLLAQALFGDPDLLLLDEPTNNLDIAAINWLKDFLLIPARDRGLHDRHFLNTICTHIVDIDYGKIKMYVVTYDFWYESSQLVQQLFASRTSATRIK